jgi:hypothetical protein
MRQVLRIFEMTIGGVLLLCIGAYALQGAALIADAIL